MLEYVQHWTQSLKGRFAFSAIIAIYVIQFSILGWLALSFFLSLLFAARIRMVRTGRPMPILTSATPRLLLPATGEVRRGKMRKRGPAVRSYTTDEDCLAAALFLRDEKGDLFLWQLRSAELELDAEDGARVQVLGAIALSGNASRVSLEPRLWKLLGLPFSPSNGGRAEEIVVREGDRVELYGPIRPAAGGYREATVEEIRGLPGNPITVSLL